MKLRQYVGPFTEDLIISLRNVIFLTLGIEYPHSIPLSEYETNNNTVIYPLRVSINKGQDQPQHDFVITDKDILELTMNKQNISIIFHEYNNPYVIVNVAYEDTN